MRWMRFLVVFLFIIRRRLLCVYAFEFVCCVFIDPKMLGKNSLAIRNIENTRKSKYGKSSATASLFSSLIHSLYMRIYFFYSLALFFCSVLFIICPLLTLYMYIYLYTVNFLLMLLLFACRLLAEIIIKFVSHLWNWCV